MWNDVFAVTVAAAPRLSPPGVSLRRYAFRIARNLRADRLRLAKRLQTVPMDENSDRSEPSLSPPDPARVEALRECLVQAPERYRLVIELTDQGDGVAELAALFRVQPESVHQLRRRAREWLAQCIEARLS